MIIYRQQCFGFFTLLEHMELTLGLEGKARRRALAKTRSLMQDAPPRDGDPGLTQHPAPDAPARDDDPGPTLPPAPDAPVPYV